MPRLEPLSFDAISDTLQSRIRAGEELLGFQANDGLTMARHPALLDGLLQLVQAVYSPGRVDDSLKRLIGLMASSAAGCQYCVAHTASSAQRLGVTEAKLEAIWDYETSPLYSDRERAALHLARLSAQTPNGVTDANYTSFADYFDESEQVEIVAVIALFGFLNRWNSTLATDIESTPLRALKRISREVS